jgi:AraC-like DNA-binding protein
MSKEELFLRLADLALLAVAAGMLVRDLKDRPTAALGGGLWCLGVAAYLICPVAVRVWPQGGAAVPVLILCYGNPALFWLFCDSLFDDRSPTPLKYVAAFVLLSGLGLAASFGGLAAATTTALTQIGKIISIAIVVWALGRMVHGRANDLVEGRRRLRLVIAGVTGFYVLGVITAEVLLIGAEAPAILELGNLTAIAILNLAVILTLGFKPARRTTAIGAASADPRLLDRVRQAMETDLAYRQEGLTIGSLASQLGVPEHSLRRAINQGLGHANFNQFLNHYRLAEAANRLADPAQRRTPILTIALEAGYASIGPFNRAFKASTGRTPSQFRTDALSSR